MNTRQRSTTAKHETTTPAPRVVETAMPTAAPAPEARFGHDFATLEVFAPPERGPFSPEINAVLSTAFGESLEDVTVTRGARAFNDVIGARASAVGSEIFLNDDISESLESPDSMEIIAHEVAHMRHMDHSPAARPLARIPRQLAGCNHR
ncbi:MAG: DUF4157 domain-containing protein [Pleurocapsa sp. SU_196_0]|nr:DUF4157 domain-containing protein [Pleurocapsa sp. SU_196_0]